MKRIIYLMRLNRSLSFYNDHKKIYLQVSQAMSDSKFIYKRKHSFQSSLLQKQQPFKKDLKPLEVQSVFRRRYESMTNLKYAKLINRKRIKSNISESRSMVTTKRWQSPFLKAQTIESKLKDKQLSWSRVKRKIPGQIKVLNIDRLFRKNAIIPMLKLSQVTYRPNQIKTLKAQNGFQSLMEQYNKLLALQKESEIKGIRGKRMTCQVTLEGLMGVKSSARSKFSQKDRNLITQQTFKQNCKSFREIIKQDVHLRRRLIAGIKQQEQQFNFTVFVRFYQIFVCGASGGKVEFLLYFFVPYGQESIDFSMLKLILQIMCEELPRIEELKFDTQSLNGQQRSKIFLQALIKVLFQGITMQTNINKSSLKYIFQYNPQAVDLLIKLLKK